MSRGFASEKRAWGLCDRCGQRYRLNKLKNYTIMGKPVYSRVCPPCWDGDHPQNFVGIIGARLVANDPQALRNPRPDTSKDDSLSLCAWKPVATQTIRSILNSVTVVV